MRKSKSPPPQDFEIHVDSSCLSDNDATMTSDRIPSNETAVHDDSWTEEELRKEVPATNEEVEEEVMGHNVEEDEKENSPPPTDVDAEETSKEPELEKEVVHDTTEADEPAEEIKEPVKDIAEPEPTIEEEDLEREARERRIERIEAEIQAAARAVVANIHSEQYEANEDSVLSAQTDESYDQETNLTYDGEEPSINDGGEDSFVTDNDDVSEHQSDHEGGDSSSHHDGDVDDDVFSSSDRSKRSSMDSLHSSDSIQKNLTSPTVGEEAASANEGEVISRIPSLASYIHTPQPGGDHTPSKVLNRPPFRTPSSVRAMQMTSPTASLFSSPRSAKRQLPTVSRLGTPNSQYSPSKRTPTRLKPRKTAPLVLLHVTVLPLQWPYSHLMTLVDIPESLHHVKESWRLLQDKVGDTVLERGILLSHPQESYEVLEERLYEALELPVRPRAKILKCGHYMGPLDPETPSSDEENDYFEGADIVDGRKWCDICGRDVRVEEVGDLPRGEKRFTVKIYASNGLMRAGAWEAAWREMERVDVELEPFVDTTLRAELEHLAAITPRETQEQDDHDDGFEDEEVIEHVDEHSNEQERQVQDCRAREKEEMIARMAKEDEMKQRIMEEDEMRKRMAEEEEMHNLMAEEELLKQRMAEEDAMRRHMDEQNAMRQNVERMREIYLQEADRSGSPRRASSRSSMVHDDSSFAELLLAAFRVVLRDSRNLAIGVLSVVVLLLALSAKTTVNDLPMSKVVDTASVAQFTTTIFKEATVTSIQNVLPITEEPVSVASLAVDPVTISKITTTVIHTVTEKAPVSTSAESFKDTLTTSVAQVTTTVFREKTITELVPAPTPSEKAIDPCETSIASARSQAPIESAPAQMEEPVSEERFKTEISEEIEAVEKSTTLTEESSIVGEELSEADTPILTEEPAIANEEPAQKVFGPELDASMDLNESEVLIDETPETPIPMSEVQTPKP